MALLDKRVLYISYNGMLDPLGQSQVIPYLKELSKVGVRFWLISFERAHAFADPGKMKAEKLRQELAQFGIEWHVLRYHQTPSLPATAYDVSAGVRLGAKLIRKNGIEMVHARAHIPAVIALRLKQRLGAKMIFDVRGLMAEEYIDAGHWKARGTAARVTKTMEARALRAADGVVTLTQALWQAMRNWPALKDRNVAHQVIPCCIDLQRFHFDQQLRDTRRSELGITDRLVLVYSGSVGGWYMTDEMAQFFAALKQREPRAYFLWLTQGDRAIVDEAMQRCGIASSDFAVTKVEPAAVSEYLTAADAGIAFYRPGISRLGTSPVKLSEYLACGLPVVINRGIGDSDSLAQEHNVAAMVSDFNSDEYTSAAEELLRLTADSGNTRQRTRGVAEKLFDLRGSGIDRYVQLYVKVFSKGS